MIPKIMTTNNISNNDSAYAQLRPRNRGWWWLVAAVILLGLGGSFAFAVYGEISRRNQAINDILEPTQRAGGILNSTLLEQLKGQLISSSTVAIGTAMTSSDPTKNQTRQLIEKMDRPRLGNASSSIVIVVFSDFECPICLEEFPIFRTITNKYANDILFIYRNYPVKGDNSAMMAQVGLCANEQGKFWQVHDKLFMNQGQMTNSEDFKKVVLSAGLNWTKLQACVDSAKYRDMVLADMADALDLGVLGTPTFFVNGTKLEGAVTLDNWEQIIKKAKELNK